MSESTALSAYSQYSHPPSSVVCGSTGKGYTRSYDISIRKKKRVLYSDEFDVRLTVKMPIRL